MTTLDLSLFVLTLLAAVGSALVGGVFFGFSMFVMTALVRRPPVESIAAMQSINVVVLRSGFMPAFLGTAVVCAVGAIFAIWRWDEPGAVYRLVGGALYLIGCFGVTIAFNVPRNDALASLLPGSSEAAKYWPTYASEWTAWNHVRTAAAIAAAIAFCLALRY